MQHAEKLFKTFIEEFKTRAAEILDPIIYSYIRRGINPQNGIARYQKDGYHLAPITGFQPNLLIQFIRNRIRDWESSKAIVEWVIANNLWHGEKKSVESDWLSLPSVSANIVAGFLVRNFVINDYQFTINDNSFQTTLKELGTFFEKDNISFASYVSLMGPSGDLSPITLSDDVAILRSDAALTKMFNRFYSSADDHYVEMFEGDYLLEFRFVISKHEIFELTDIENKAIKKWRLVPLLAGIGNLEIGKIIRASSDWPLVTIDAPNRFFSPLNTYDNFQSSEYNFSETGVPLLQRAIQIISQADIAAIDKSIVHAIDRIIKAKKVQNLDDKVVELALAMEYLINTSPNEVSLQLRVKGTILYNIEGEEEWCHQVLKEFYNLRSKVVHGNSSLVNDVKTKTLVQQAELILLTITLRMLELNCKYSYLNISKALNQALYKPSSLKAILDS